MSLNRQPGDLVQHELAALTQIAKGTDIVSKDGEPVGQATKLHERKEDIDPAAKLYQFYFRVARPTMGNAAYVPADFVEIESSDQLRLTVTAEAFEHERWDAAPTFIAVVNDTTHELP